MPATPVQSASHTSVIRLVIRDVGDGWYLARSPDVPGLNAQAKSYAEAAKLAQQLIGELVEYWNDEGIELPPKLRDGSAGKRMEVMVPVEVAHG